MLNRIIDASVRLRWLVVGLAVVLAVLGGRELMRLPIEDGGYGQAWGMEDRLA